MYRWIDRKYDVVGEEKRFRICTLFEPLLASFLASCQFPLSFYFQAVSRGRGKNCAPPKKKYTEAPGVFLTKANSGGNIFDAVVGDELNST